MAIRHIHSSQFLPQPDFRFDFATGRYKEGLHVANMERFFKEADKRDTYIAIISPYILDRWKKYKKKFKDWIVYEGPGAINTNYGEAHGRLYTVILERPKNG